MKPVSLTAADVQILTHLQADPRMSMAALAEATHSSLSPCWRRVKRLEESGVIQGYQLRLNRKALNLGIEAFVFVRIATHQAQHAVEFEQAVQDFDQILSCHILSGNEDYLLRVVASDLDGFADFGRRVLANLPHVRDVRSAFVLNVIKETSTLPLSRVSLQAP